MPSSVLFISSSFSTIFSISFTYHIVLPIYTLFASLYSSIFPTGNAAGKPQTNDSAPTAAMKPSIIIDLWENRGKGKYKDYVKLANSTLRQNIMFNIYGYDQENNQWVIIGPAKLNVTGDTDTVDTPWRGRMNEFRWLAVHSLDNISFDALADINRNDITVTITDINVSGDWGLEKGDSISR